MEPNDSFWKMHLSRIFPFTDTTMAGSIQEAKTLILLLLERVKALESKTFFKKWMKERSILLGLEVERQTLIIATRFIESFFPSLKN